MHGVGLLSDLGTAIVAATAAALLARALRQPLILGYLLAGVLVGPDLGFGLVHERENIELISEIGLILLLFIIGLEMDLQKLMGAGTAPAARRPPAVPDLRAASAPPWPWRWASSSGSGRFDAAYVGVAMALSSTMIVVKLLYDKHELMTLPGPAHPRHPRLPGRLGHPGAGRAALAHEPVGSHARSPRSRKGAALVVVSLLASRYLLPRLFALIAKVPELLLVTALAWCFLVSGAASALGLSREMGALIAGVGLSTFPYNLDVIAKVVNIRDFFVTLFFVALGMQIPMPTTATLVAGHRPPSRRSWWWRAASSRCFPILYATGLGLRASLLPAINLAQMSEFSLVIAALGLSLGHIAPATVAVMTLVFSITSVASTYMIACNHELQAFLGGVLGRLGLRSAEEDAPADDHLERRGPSCFSASTGTPAPSSTSSRWRRRADERFPILKKMLIIDFNPQVLDELERRGIRCLYGDIASMETLHHASISKARLVVCTLTDSVLKGTSQPPHAEATPRTLPARPRS